MNHNIVEKVLTKCNMYIFNNVLEEMDRIVVTTKINIDAHWFSVKFDGVNEYSFFYEKSTLYGRNCQVNYTLSNRNKYMCIRREIIENPDVRAWFSLHPKAWNITDANTQFLGFIRYEKAREIMRSCEISRNNYKN